jgi:hypothetical protein
MRAGPAISASVKRLVSLNGLSATPIAMCLMAAVEDYARSRGGIAPTRGPSTSSCEHGGERSRPMAPIFH